MDNRDELKLYRVIPKYVSALQDENNGGDRRVYNVGGGKESRAFIGILTVCNGQKYCIPLTRPKDKFKNMKGHIDFGTITDNGKIIAGIEYSRMIPVEDHLIRPLEMDEHNHDTDNQKAMKRLRRKEAIWLKENREEVVNKANVLYNKYISGEKFKQRTGCLNFPALEKICKEYCQIHTPQHPPKTKDKTNSNNKPY